MEALQFACKACDWFVCCPCFEARPSWQFETDITGTWSLMSPQDVSKLETKYSEDPGSKSTMTLGAKNWNYTVDFSDMTQVNPRNNSTRTLRRVGGRHVKTVAERKKEEDEKQEVQRRRAQEVADQIFQAEAELEAEQENKLVEKRKREEEKRAKAAAKRKSQEEPEAGIKRLEAEAESKRLEAEPQASVVAENKKAEQGILCACCSRPKMGDDVEADEPIQYQSDAKPQRPAASTEQP